MIYKDLKTYSLPGPTMVLLKLKLQNLIDSKYSSLNLVGLQLS